MAHAPASQNSYPTATESCSSTVAAAYAALGLRIAACNCKCKHVTRHIQIGLWQLWSTWTTSNVQQRTSAHRPATAGPPHSLHMQALPHPTAHPDTCSCPAL